MIVKNNLIVLMIVRENSIVSMIVKDNSMVSIIVCQLNGIDDSKEQITG